MELTPVKVTGKRRQNNKSIAVKPRKRVKTKSTELRREFVKDNASYLEIVPLEILERIFWFSGNVNLPLSSPRIGRFLSGKSTLEETFIYAFKPTWDGCFGITGPVGVQRYHNRPERDIPGYYEGNPEFQSALMEFPWTNISLILRCWDMYIERRVKSPEKFKAAIEYSTDEPQKLITTPTRLPWDCHLIFEPQKANAYFHEYYAQFRGLEHPIVVDYIGPLSLGNYYQVHADIRIPDSLLLSPRTEGNLQKLFWLVRGGACLSPEQDWEFTLNVFNTALSEDFDQPGHLGFSVVEILYYLKAYKQWPEYVFDDVTNTRESVKSRASATLFNHYEPLLSQFRWSQF
ncbi:hypothetical protein F4781DRAFT_436446 [Annulohypoxylon bovei var. microspora]|nr:hypothetical protein F4781DRAFT_436446 [Annulohypoxylon bovei var. microspora]